MYIVKIYTVNGWEKFFGPFMDNETAEGWGEDYPDYEDGEETHYEVYLLNHTDACGCTNCAEVAEWAYENPEELPQDLSGDGENDYEVRNFWDKKFENEVTYEDYV